MLSKEDTINILESTLKSIDLIDPNNKDGDREVIRATIDSAIKYIKYPNSYVNFYDNNIATQNKDFMDAVDNHKLVIRLDIIRDDDNKAFIINPLAPHNIINESKGEDKILANEANIFLHRLLRKNRIW